MPGTICMHIHFKYAVIKLKQADFITPMHSCGVTKVKQDEQDSDTIDDTINPKAFGE